MSSVGDYIRMDRLLKSLKGKDISNCIIIFGTCKDCKRGQKCEHGVYCTNLGGTNKEDWYCADFEQRGDEDGK